MAITRLRIPTNFPTQTFYYLFPGDRKKIINACTHFVKNLIFSWC